VPNIREWYKARKGTINGLPVLHVSVHITPFYEYQCEQFTMYYGLQTVMNDYNANPSRGPVQTNVVHDQFNVPFKRPVLLVITCVSNSSYNPVYQLMLTEDGGTGDFGEPTYTRWRTAIDAVQAPLPQITNARLEAGGAFRFNFPGQRGRTNQVLCSSNLLTWTVLTNVIGTNAPILFRDANPLSGSPRMYRIRRL